MSEVIEIIDLNPPPTDPIADSAAEHSSRGGGLLLGAALLALAGCGGGTDAGSSPAPVAGPTPAPTPAPAPAPAPVPTPIAVLPTAQEAARFLQQTTFGATAQEISAVQTKGYPVWIDDQMAAPKSQSYWDGLVELGFSAATENNSRSAWDFIAWRKPITSTDQLRQRMAFALSQIMVVGVDGVTTSWPQMATAAYADILADNAFGNFRALLEKVSLSIAMGVYLSHRGNLKEDPASGRLPDENYAREVMQLFTIGLYELNNDGSLKLSGAAPIETYDQADVSGLARVFTGWDYDSTDNTTPDRSRRPMTNRASNHSTSPKVFLTANIPANTSATDSLKIALDALFNHPNVGPFIGKQLIQRLVTSNPSAAYIGRVATAFNNSGGVRGDLAATLKAVLLDADARDITRAGTGKLIEPVIRLTQWARTMQATSPNGKWNFGNTSDPATKIGQSPFRSASVFNFFRPGYLPPSTAISAQGYAAPEFQLTNESSVAGYINYMQTVISTGIDDIRGSYDPWLAKIDQPDALLADLNLQFAANRLSSASIDNIKAALLGYATTTDAGKRNRLYAAVLLVMASPEYLSQK